MTVGGERRGGGARDKNILFTIIIFPLLFLPPPPPPPLPRLFLIGVIISYKTCPPFTFYFFLSHTHTHTHHSIHPTAYNTLSLSPSLSLLPSVLPCGRKQPAAPPPRPTGRGLVEVWQGVAAYVLTWPVPDFICPVVSLFPV